MENTLENTAADDKEPGSAKPAGEKNRDLSAEIISTVKREKNERVTCRRISGDYYRVNWWCPEGVDSYDNPAMGGLLVTTNRICKSWFVHVVPTAGGKLKMTVR